MSSRYAMPRPSRRMLRLTFRNYRVWRRLMFPSISMNIAEPLIFFVGFGFGLGALIGTVNGGSYMEYIATGMVAYGAMFSASFESLYSAFARMHVQRTWQSILNTPMLLDDILLGEWLWAGIKGTIAGMAMLLVGVALGAVSPLGIPFIILVAVLTALTFSAIGLSVNAVANSYDFFSYYFTLFLTPMMMVSGVFFPLTLMPAPLQALSHFLPLTHAVALLRPLAEGEIPPQAVEHIGILVFYTAAGLYISALLTRRRLLK